MKRTWLLILVLISSVVWGKPTTMSANFFIATKGNDSWSGKLAAPNRKKTDGPFATLGRARDELRKLKKEGKLPPSGVTVEVGKGLYEFARPLEFSSEDSGSEIAPIVYRAQPGAQVRLVGGKVVTGWKPVTDPAALGRLDESARGKVMQADLRTLGITSYGQVGGGFGLSGGPGMELFFDDKPMTMARWPNEGFVRIPNVLGETPVDVRGTKGCAEGLFTYEGDRPKRWAAEKDIWVHGYWFWDWADQRHQVEKIDIEKKIITLAKPYHGYGYRKGQWYYAFNVLAELDRPGEYYLDRQAGVLYFWPPEATQADGLRSLNSGKAVVSALPSLITMKDTSYVTLRGFTLEAAQGTAMTITGGENDQIVGCTLRNVGSWALSIGGGKSHSVIGCNITETGDGGISMDGGDRATLTPANHLADNNHIHHYSRWNRMYRPAITINGVGLRVAHNLIHNAPHMAIGFGGNDHIIEFNEIHSVSYESNDAGAIYAGRNWTMRGNVLRHNYLHHINGFEGRGCVGMYLDDMFSSADMYGNVFHKVTMAAFIGGGRDCSIENNIFVDCNPALHIDARAMGWAGYHADDWIKEGREKGTHLGIEFMKPPYSERYPQLLTLLDDDPKAPKGNLIARNVCWGGKWDTSIEAKARPLLKMEDNLVDEDPHFVDLANRNFQLKDDSPAYKLGFKRIPIEQIGLYKDDRRASWPVLHKVREMETPPVARKTGPPPVFKVVKAATAPQIDGVLKAYEWSGAAPKKSMPIKQGLSGEETTPTSQAWLTYDEANLYIAIDNTVSKTQPLKKGSTWGQDDAVEIAVRNPAIKNSPIIVLRGYPNNHFESSNESGISDALAKKAGEGVKYSAKIVDATRWIAEMQIPFASLGIDPGKQAKLAFNLTVRKTAESLWIMWCGTNGYSWSVENAGFLELSK